MNVVLPLAPFQPRRVGYAVTVSGVRFWVVRMVDEFRALVRRCQVQTATRRPTNRKTPPTPPTAPAAPARRPSLIEAVLTTIIAHYQTRTTSRGGH